MKVEKQSEHHYKYNGMLIVLAKGTYDPDDDASVLAKLKEIHDEVASPAE